MLERKFSQTIEKYNLLNKKEKILVAVSGGKDSGVVIYLLKKLEYNVEALHIDLGIGNYSDECLEKTKELCNQLEVKLHVVKAKKYFGEKICNSGGNLKKSSLNPCMVCGIIKKWILNKEARRLHAEKIATGHHLDDEAETVIVNFLQGNLMLGVNSGPQTGNIKDKKFIPRVKPLYFVSENKIREYSLRKKIPVIYKKCPCVAASLRLKTREFLRKQSDKAKLNIVKNFLKMIPKLRRNFHNEKLIYCENCGEPSRRKLCKKCEIFTDRKTFKR